MSEPQVLWTSDASINGWDYRVTYRFDDDRMPKTRVFKLLRLERRRSSFDDWHQVGPGVEFLRWPPRSGAISGKPHTWHSRKTAIAFLQGYADALGR